MIVSKLLNYNSSRYSEDNHDGDIKEIDKDLITLFNCLSGRVRFGNGNTGRDGENVCVYVSADSKSYEYTNVITALFV